MADVVMPEHIRCRFNEQGWSPQCNKPSDNGWCSKHEGLKCRSCGEQATTNCDAQMGGLACGALLCGSCMHERGLGHVTGKVWSARRKAEEEERAALVASRTSPVRRMDDDLGVPATLFELLKGEWQEEGYELRSVYFLVLKHSCMGHFPAIFSSDESRIVFTSDLQLLEHVWHMLDPRDATLRGELAYVNKELGILYLDAREPRHRENRRPEKLLTKEQFETIAAAEEEPFRWDHGLLGGRTPSQYAFLRDLVRQATALDSRFTSAAAG